VCNAGNANAFTGKAGDTSAELTAETVAEQLRTAPHDIFLASTGVIGETLPDAALTAAIPSLVAALEPSTSAGWQAAADAIRTTDTFGKGAAAPIAGTDAHVVGIAKGSGMIAPEMATMLAFMFTDAAVPAPLLQAALAESTEHSFNRITVDSDTSTSDTVLVFATGSADAHVGVVDSPQYAAFRHALDAVMLDLAHQIVRDGEGATKFVTVTVAGAEDDDAAKTIAMAIGNSPLVKTALAAEDANWGRIVMAVGKAGQRADRDALTIHIGPELVAAGGVQHPDYSEAQATQHLKQPEVDIAVDVGIGDGSATIWSCDLTHGYIDINAGYRS
jgi:glutamate N-acetyltransferase/amino-acid N-acetyltransferase